MARKGSHPRNGAVRNGAKAKTKFSEVLNPLPLDSTGKPVADGQKIFEDKGQLDASDCERFFGSLNSNTEERNSSESVKKTYRVGNASHREGSKARNTCEKSDTFSNNLNGVKLTFTLDDSRGDSVISDRDNHISEISDNIQNAEVEHDPMARRRLSVKLAIKHLLVLIWHLLQLVITWVERQRPLVNTFTMVIFDARDYVQIKIKHAYPILRSWVSHFVKILFLLSMAWLDCSLRGLGSLLHLGTTCFFTIFWCSLLSLLAMIGITKMLLTLVMAGLVVLFAGLGIAFLMVAITSAVVLWFYGNFWTTVLVIILGGAAFGLSHERIALFLTTVYSLHCTGYYMGWLGLFMALNLSFISSDVLINFLRSSIRNQESEVRPEQTTASNNRANTIHEESKRAIPPDDSSNSSFERSIDHDAGVPSTSGASAELTSENEVVRLLTCTDHYSALGFARYESIDVSSLKREYKKKAMLVHPDKNMGNEKAAEAFKKLQNAYEVLLDSLKRKTYDDELRREEILNYFRRFQHISRKNGGNGDYGPGFSQDSGNDHSTAEARRIACKKCGNLHIWIHMNRPKSRARWCQDCKDFHHAKDGDGWVEQSSQPLMFGLLNKLDPPRAYVCADSIIYDATEWFNCQGMRCPVNNHKPTFHINTAVTSSKHNAKGTHSSGGGTAGAFPGANMDETMTEEELMEWLQNAMQSGAFYAPGNTADEGTPTKTSSFPKSVSKKKRKGKKPW